MNDKIRGQLIKFRDDRNWGKFHTIDNLLQSLNIETAELQRLFQWGKKPDIEEVTDEIADIIIYLEYIAMHYDIDIEKAVSDKIKKNAKKYPKFFESPHKWGIRKS